MSGSTKVREGMRGRVALGLAWRMVCRLECSGEAQRERVKDVVLKKLPLTGALDAV